MSFLTDILTRVRSLYDSINIKLQGILNGAINLITLNQRQEDF